jgi:PAS domain S-box-containing protein
MNPARILVVEDEFIVAKEIEMRLTAMGYQVAASALKADEALKLAEQHRPDLVLMDIRLQGEMDGITVAEKIRERFHLPVIFLTAYSEDTTLERAKLAEPYGYILKPFEERELKSAIEIALYKHRAEHEILRMNRLFDVLSQANQAIVRAHSRDDLLDEICRILVERSTVNLAWIGWFHPETAMIRPVAHWGRHEEILNLAEFYADDRPEGYGNPGRAIRENKPFLCNECIQGNCLYPAEFAPSQFGFKSCGSFPIHFKNRVCGVLNIGIDEAGFFQEREIKLLEEVALDISFALDKLEGDARRVQAEEALQKSEKQYRLLVDTSNEGVWMMNGEHVTTYVNQAMANMLGYEPSEMIGTKVEDYFFSEDQTFHQQRMKQRHAGQDEVYERRFKRRDGSQLWTLVSAKSLKDDQERFLGSFAMFTDISERKRAEESILESEARFRGYFELGLIGMAITSIEKGWVQFNDRLCDIFGYTREELSQLTWAELTHPDDLAADVAQFDRILRGESDSYRMEKRFIRKDCMIIHAKISVQCVRRVDGKIDHFIAMVDDITERKRIEEALRGSEERFRLFMDNSSTIAWIKDELGRYVYVSRTYETRFGVRLDEWLGKTDAELWPPEVAEAFRRNDLTVLESDCASEVIEQTINADGSQCFWLNAKFPFCDGAGNRFVGGIGLDITERRHAQEMLLQKNKQLQEAVSELERARSMLRLIIESIPVRVFWKDKELRYLGCNSLFARDAGFHDPQELLGKDDFAMVWREQAKLYRTEDSEVIKSCLPRMNFVEPQTTPEGSTIWLSTSKVPLCLADGEVFGVLGVYEDITKRKRTEETLRDSEEKYRLAMEAVSDGLWDWNCQTGKVYYSPGWCHIIDEESVSSVFESWRQRIHPEDSDKILGPLKEHLEGKTNQWEQEHRLRTRSGQWKWVLGRGRVVARTDTGSPLRMVGTMVDISERRQAEESVRENEEKFRTLFETMAEGVFYQGLDGALIDANPAALEMLGLSLDELGQGSYDPSYDVFHEDGTPSPPDEYPSLVALRTGKPIKGAIRGVFNPKKKCQVWMTLNAIPQFHQGEAVPYRVFVTLHDLTQRKLDEESKKKLESRLRHAQKLEAIGTLAGGIAHDFNNILTPIIGYTEMALNTLEESDPITYDLNEVLTAANRAKDLVKQILTSSRLGEEQLMRPMDASLIVKEAMKLIRASLPSTIEIRQNIRKVTVVGDATQIHQIVVNLCTNAAHAMKDTGIMDVSLMEVDLGSQDLVGLSTTDLRPGKHLKLSVKDSGTGMDPETMERIFDPYFTTKEVGKGTGLGLAVVHGIVKRHGGEILVRSEIGKGSVFDVFIPVAESNLKSETSDSEDLPKGNERILLVDDEPAIARLGARMLVQLGYSVIAKTSPREALDLFIAEPDRFDLVITDYTMPRMVGTELTKACKQIRAEIPVIICTGYSERLTQQVSDQIGVQALAMKPLNLKQLAVLVRAVLDDGRSEKS